MGSTGEGIREPQLLSEERIKQQTGFSLAIIFPDFARSNGFVSPGLQEDQERFAGMFGEDNVLPSFYIDEADVVQLGLFVRQTETRD